MPNNSHPLYSTKDPDSVKLNVAALLWIVLYTLAIIIVFGVHLTMKPKYNHNLMKRAGWPVDVQRTVTVKSWGLV